MDFDQLKHETYTRSRSESLEHLLPWHIYGKEAFDEAKKENKPIYLVLSAPAWCHWCHVYESEDFLYHPTIYPYIKEHFIPVFVDSDKRQDLTQKYLEGGWPSTVILTPDGTRVFGFSGPQPPKTLRKLLEDITTAWKGGEFTNHKHVKAAASTVCTAKLANRVVLEEMLSKYEKTIVDNFDYEFGGFGGALAPGAKFPQGYTLDFMLEHYEATKDKKFLDMALLETKNHYTNPNNLKDYKLYDPVEGGFHRYSVAHDWTKPHYEKMLSENARLLRAYAHVAKITGDNFYKNIVDQTIHYITSTLYDKSGGGYYGSQDADGEEHYFGKSLEEREELTKPFVDTTKYSHWNGEMITTMIKLAEDGWKGTKVSAYKSLDFFVPWVSREKGMCHYDGRLYGQLTNTSFFALALLEGYIATEKNKYLESLEMLLEFAVKKLYDNCKGVFIARNSQELEHYASPEDAKDDQALVLENGVMAYVMVRSARYFTEDSYLRSGLSTLSYFAPKLEGFDEQYYFMKAAKVALEK